MHFVQYFQNNITWFCASFVFAVVYFKFTAKLLWNIGFIAQKTLQTVGARSLFRSQTVIRHLDFKLIAVKNWVFTFLYVIVLSSSYKTPKYRDVHSPGFSGNDSLSPKDVDIIRDWLHDVRIFWMRLHRHDKKLRQTLKSDISSWT